MRTLLILALLLTTQARTLVDETETPHNHTAKRPCARTTASRSRWGARVEPGAALYAINPSSRHLAVGPSYRGPQPIRNGDVANLVTTVLGLPAVPGFGVRGP